MKTQNSFLSMLRLDVLFVLFVTGIASAQSAVLVTDARVWPAPQKTRVVLDVTDNPRYSTQMLSNPDRFVIDVADADMARGLERLLPNGGLVKRVRSGSRGMSDLRLVLDLEAAVSPRVAVLQPNEVYGHRLVVDLFPAGAERPADLAAKPEPAIQPPRHVPRKQSQVAPPDSAQRDLLIAIDAGHGGEDAGAIGRGGTMEKDVVLAVSRELERLVKAEPGMRPVMIRNGDYYVGLRDRITLARKAKADIFISIHANSFKHHDVDGAAVYALSRRGASGEHARWLAQRENAADLVGGVSLTDKEDTLASVLLDLSQSATMEASLDLARTVLGELGAVGKIHKRKVQQAGFMVLKAPDIPSILVETAFISNPAEERKLGSRKYQRKLAKAVLSGTLDYFRANPVQGSWLAEQTQRGKRKRLSANTTGSAVASR